MPEIVLRACVADDKGNVSHAPDDSSAEFWGVYMKLEDGRWNHLVDFEACEDAETCREALHRAFLMHGAVWRKEDEKWT